MQKDTHKVESYKFVCKVPPQCSPVLAKTQQKKQESTKCEGSNDEAWEDHLQNER